MPLLATCRRGLASTLTSELPFAEIRHRATRCAGELIRNIPPMFEERRRPARLELNNICAGRAEHADLAGVHHRRSRPPIPDRAQAWGHRVGPGRILHRHSWATRIAGYFCLS